MGKSKNPALELGATLLVCLIVGVIMLRVVFDTTEMEEKARSLVGRPVDQIEKVLKKPSRVVPQAEFNSKYRGDVLQSFSPKDVPLAAGRVYVYDPKLTIILLFEEKGIVKRVYVGKT